MSDLQPFLISEFETGLSSYLQPWIRPRDAFEPLENAYTYRGVLNKRNGSVPFGNQLSDQQPVMGIMQYIDESTGVISLVVASTQNAYLYIPGSNTFSLLTAVAGFFWSGTATGTIVIDTLWKNIVPASVTISDGIDTLTFNAGGAQNSAASGIFAAGSSINYTTGVVTINFTATTPNVSLTLAATLTAGYFTGDNTNFFNWVSWEATTTVASKSFLYMTNNVDPVTLFDGTSLSRPIFYTDSAHTKYVTKTLDIAVYQNRLLFLRPTILNDANPSNQSIAWSAQFNPTNFVNDVAGNGGFTVAPTGDILQSQESLRNTLVVFFTTSVWQFRFTGSPSDPFRWDKITIAKSVSAPYGSVAYDERCTAVGNLGLIACDGTNVQRYDTTIIDYYETEMNEQYFNQIFAQRYDNLNQTWMLYVSNGTLNPVVGTGAPGADRALIYNYAEQSWCTYTFNLPMTCMGKFFSVSGVTWADLTQSWDQTDETWKSYSKQKAAPILLIGDVTGNVYWIDNETAVSDYEVDVTGEVIAAGSGATLYSGTLANPPLLPGTFAPTDGTETFTDQGNGILVGSAGGNGNINYDTGDWQLMFAAAVPLLTNITASYTHGYSILPNITTTRWNPVLQTGQKTQFPYIDIYYSIVSTDPVNPVQLTLSFYANNSDNEAVVRTLTLDGPTDSGYTFKRIYTNLIGEFFQMNIDPNVDATFQILGFIIWARTAGRLTPGLLL